MSETRGFTAYLIDPDEMSVREVTLPDVTDARQLQNMYELLQCKALEAVRLDPNAGLVSDVVYLDEEGLFKRQTGFALKGHVQPSYVGRGLVCGTTRDGDTCSPNASLEQVRALIRAWTFPA